MRVFFDECVPRPLRHLLAGHTIQTAQDMGWRRLKNGELLAQAEAAGFEVFTTSDQNLAYQQNLSARRIALLVLSTNYWPRLRQHHALVAAELARIEPGQYVELNIPAESEKK